MEISYYDKKAPGGIRLSPDEIMKRQEIAQKKKDEFQQLYQDAYEFALPQRQLYGIWEGGASGMKKMQRVFDSTAINSTQRFANRLQSVVFPPQRKWPGSSRVRLFQWTRHRWRRLSWMSTKTRCLRRYANLTLTLQSESFSWTSRLARPA